MLPLRYRQQLGSRVFTISWSPNRFQTMSMRMSAVTSPPFRFSKCGLAAVPDNRITHLDSALWTTTRRADGTCEESISSIFRRGMLACYGAASTHEWRSVVWSVTRTLPIGARSIVDHSPEPSDWAWAR